MTLLSEALLPSCFLSMSVIAAASSSYFPGYGVPGRCVIIICTSSSIGTDSKADRTSVLPNSPVGTFSKALSLVAS